MTGPILAVLLNAIDAHVAVYAALRVHDIADLVADTVGHAAGGLMVAGTVVCAAAVEGSEAGAVDDIVAYFSGLIFGWKMLMKTNVI